MNLEIMVLRKTRVKVTERQRKREREQAKIVTKTTVKINDKSA